MSDNIQGNVVVITGASSGLGSRREEKLNKLADEINNGGGAAVIKQTDVTDRSQVQVSASSTRLTRSKPLH